MVKRKDEFFLIAEEPATPTRPARAYRYRLPGNDNLNSDLGVALSEEAVEVPEQWLLLFDAGGSLDADGLALDGAGERPDFAGSDQLPGRARIGDYFRDVNERPAVITQDGVATFSEFAFRVLINTEFGGFRPEELDVGSDAGLPSVTPPYEEADAHWPEATLSPADGELCAQLHARARRPAPRSCSPRRPTGEASAEDVDDPGAEESSVDSGHGAYVMSGGSGRERRRAPSRSWSTSAAAPTRSWARTPPGSSATRTTTGCWCPTPGSTCSARGSSCPRTPRSARRPARRARRRVSSAGAVAGLLAGAIACAGLTCRSRPPAYAEEGACSEIQDDTTDVDEVKAPSVPLEELRHRGGHRAARA